MVSELTKLIALVNVVMEDSVGRVGAEEANALMAQVNNAVLLRQVRDIFAPVILIRALVLPHRIIQSIVYAAAELA